uniref:Uncharacterized protein n=1 Tax=Phlebotomus papatasi TaxID=29031 RepID=A0A1B0D945_PHLPP
MRAFILMEPRTSTYWEEDVPKFSDVQFKADFRASRSTFEFLVEKLSEHLMRIDTVFREAIPVRKRIAVALYALGSSAEYRTIANVFGLGTGTVAELVLEFCHVVVYLLEREFVSLYPPTRERILEITQGFNDTWGFPQTYGAVDGCHIEVTVPDELKTDYYNFKGWHSIVLLAAVDHRYRFTYLNIGSPGRNNDSYIFERSALKDQHMHNQLFFEYSRNIENFNTPVLLLGDSAFRLSHFLMKPYPQTDLQPKERHFNYMLSRSRRVVENAFGQLKNRFRRIGKGLDVHIDNAPVFVRAVCILHNVLNEMNDGFGDVAEEPSHQEQPTFMTNVGNDNLEANHMRDCIAEYLFRNHQQSRVLLEENGNA